MANRSLFVTLFLFAMIQGIIRADDCPVPKYVQKHVCRDCWTKEKAIAFAKKSNNYRKDKACLVHIFDESSKKDDYTSQRGQCLLKESVGGWMCFNVMSDRADCIQVTFF